MRDSTAKSRSKFCQLAQFGKACAIKSKAEYEKFFVLWKESDIDIPGLKAAKMSWKISDEKPAVK